MENVFYIYFHDKWNHCKSNEKSNLPKTKILPMHVCIFNCVIAAASKFEMKAVTEGACSTLTTLSRKRTYISGLYFPAESVYMLRCNRKKLSTIQQNKNIYHNCNERQVAPKPITRMVFDFECVCIGH